MTTISWLHLSDWHQNRPNYDRKVVLGRLLASIKDRATIDPRLTKIDFVVFSGDLAWSGQAAEFIAAEKEFLRPVLEAVGLDSNRLFIVPGNHDLDASTFELLPAELTKPLTDEAAVQKWQVDSRRRAKLLEPFEAFNQWAEGFTGRRSDYGCLAELDVDGYTVRLAGLNAALMCRRNEVNGKVHDRGWLVIGEPQTDILTHDAAAANELRIAVQHHSFDWLTEGDMGRVKDRITRWADILLLGHNHQQRADSQSGDGGECATIAGGAAYDRRDNSSRYANAYNYGLLDLDAQEGRVFFQKWEDGAPGEWRADRTKDLPLPSRLRQRAAREQAAQQSQQQQEDAALEAYCRALLTACDLVDLSGLPVEDLRAAERARGLRRLYIPLHVNPYQNVGAEGEDDLTFGAARQRLGQNTDKERTPATAFFAGHRRAVLLGDPGAGKSTLARWLAYHYLLRRQDDDSWRDGVAAALPDEDLLPVLLRCRDIPETARRGCFKDMLTAALDKRALAPDTATKAAAAIWRRIEDGTALLIVDGLDEIAAAECRQDFCIRIREFCETHPQIHVFATSRIVGYQAVRGRLGPGFEHAVLAPLDPDEKDDFARRWCAAIETHDADAVAAALIDSIHSNDNVERLTGNPILLTTMALVKRKLGRLPQRRARLYDEAVKVLLRWGGEAKRIVQPLEEDEALPQLGWLAYAMCARGVARLDEETAVQLLNDMRAAWPNLQALKNDDPKGFLRRVEAQSGILHQCGLTRSGVNEVAVYEFRHLTFQEFLAARALVDGKYPGHQDGVTLPQQVGRLAKSYENTYISYQVVEQWREALRLTATLCGDEDAEPLLTAILTPTGDDSKEAEGRVHLAMLALADEPNNISAALAERILDLVVTYAIAEGGHLLAASPWGNHLRVKALDAFMLAEGRWQERLFNLLWLSQQNLPDEEAPGPNNPRDFVVFVTRLVWASRRRQQQPHYNQLMALISSLNRSPAEAAVAAFALVYLTLFSDKCAPAIYEELAAVLARVALPPAPLAAALWTLTRNPHPMPNDLADGLRPYLRHEDWSVATATVDVLSTGIDETDRRLLRHKFNINDLSWCPKYPITPDHCQEAADALNLSVEEVKARYRALAPDFALNLQFD